MKSQNRGADIDLSNNKNANNVKIVQSRISMSRKALSEQNNEQDMHFLSTVKGKDNQCSVT